ncbi:Hypothetical protein NocV09_00201900 [Nannochloropsis oceanica]
MDTNEMLAEPRYISISYDSPSLNADTLDDVDGAEGNSTCLKEEGNFTPRNAKNGTGCVDVKAPVLVVPSFEKTFQTCKCEGLGGPGTPAPPGCAARGYGKELRELTVGGGGEGRGLLCTDGWPCFEAYDDLPDGTRLNLTRRVVMGPDVEEDVENHTAVKAGKKTKFFVLPLSVEDDAGNKARSQLRFSVEEVSLFSHTSENEEEGEDNDSEEELRQDEKREKSKLAKRDVGAGTTAAAAAAAAVSSPPAHRPSCDSDAEPTGETEVNKEEDFDGEAVLLVILLILCSLGAWIYSSSNNCGDVLAPDEISVGGGETRDVGDDAFVYQEGLTPNSRRNRFSSPGVRLGVSPYASPQSYREGER